MAVMAIWIWVILAPSAMAFNVLHSFQYNGVNYTLLEGIGNQSAAMKSCEQLNMSLARIRSEDERDGIGGHLQLYIAWAEDIWVAGRTLVPDGRSIIPGNDGHTHKGWLMPEAKLQSHCATAGVRVTRVTLAKTPRWRTQTDKFACSDQWSLKVSDMENRVSTCAGDKCTNNLTAVQDQVCSMELNSNVINYQVTTGKVCPKMCPPDDLMLETANGGYQVWYYQAPNCIALKSVIVIEIGSFLWSVDCENDLISGALCMKTSTVPTVRENMMTTEGVHTTDHTSSASVAEATTPAAPNESSPQTFLDLLLTTPASSDKTMAPVEATVNEMTSLSSDMTSLDATDNQITPPSSEISFNSKITLIATTANQLTSPSNQITSPNHPMTSPSNQMKSPSNRLTAPSNRMTSPSNQMTSPSNRMTSPSNRMTSPSNQMTSPSNQMTSPRNQMRSPSNQMTADAFTSNEVTSNTSPSNATTFSTMMMETELSKANCSSSMSYWSIVLPCVLRTGRTRRTDVVHMVPEMPVAQLYLRTFHMKDKTAPERVTDAPLAAIPGAIMWLFVVLELIVLVLLDFAPSKLRKVQAKRHCSCHCC